MAWNGSGTFSRTNGDNTGSTTWQQDLSDGDKIVASRHDTHDQDLADGINSCLAKNGENAMTGDLDLGDNNITNVAEISGDIEYNSGTWVFGATGNSPTVEVGQFASWEFSNEPDFTNGLDVTGGTSRFKNSTTFYGSTGSYSGFITMTDDPIIYGDFSANGEFTVAGNLVLGATAPASAGASGTTGEIRVSDDFIYVKTSSGNWKTLELQSFETTAS